MRECNGGRLFILNTSEGPPIVFRTGKDTEEREDTDHYLHKEVF